MWFILRLGRKKREQLGIAEPGNKIYFRDVFVARPHFGERLEVGDIAVTLTFLWGFALLWQDYSGFALFNFLLGAIIFYYSHFNPMPTAGPKISTKEENNGYRGAEAFSTNNSSIGFSDQRSSIGEILKLYRALARRYHPDRARTLEEQLRFEFIMKEINRAYRELDEVALRAIALRLGFVDAETNLTKYGQ